MFPNISVFTGITFDMMLLAHSINLFFSIFSIFNWLFLTISVKLCGFKLKNFRIRFSSYCIFYKRVYQATKASNFFYEILRLFPSQNLRNTTTFWITKIYETIENLLILQNFSVSSHINYQIVNFEDFVWGWKFNINFSFFMLRHSFLWRIAIASITNFPFCKTNFLFYKTITNFLFYKTDFPF